MGNLMPACSVKLNIINRITMKKALIIAFALLLSVITMSQNVQYEDVVYLKNGSVIRGMIVEQIPNKTLKIKTVNRNVFVFEFAEIEKITKEEIPSGGGQVYPPDEDVSQTKYVKENGFESTVDFGLGGLVDWGSPALSLNVIAGYRFLPQLFFGGGTGIEFYDSRSMLPLFANIRTDFIKARVTPFFAVSAGYAFGWVSYDDGSDWGGMFVEPSFGVRFNFSPNFGMNLSTGLKFQRAREEYYYYEPYYPPQLPLDYSYTDTFKLFLFKVGFSF